MRFSEKVEMAACSDHSASIGERQLAVSLSVVIPNYNHSRFVRESLGSILAQRRPADQLIVVDDASTDDSISVILEVIEKAPNAKLVRNEKNMGAVASMNWGLSLATGDLVFFGAADDVYYPRLFEVGVAMLAVYPEAALFSGACDIIDIDGANKGRFMSPKPLTGPGFLGPAAALREMLRDDGWFMGNTVLYRRSTLLAAGGFDEKLGAFTDGYMCRLLALRHGACFTPETLAAWRRLEGGVASSQALRTDQANDFVALVKGRMTETGGLFPPQYMYRWQRRYLFGGLRFALMHRKSAQTGMAGRLKRGLNALKILWMFLVLRPWDIGTVSGRWIREFWDRKAFAPKKIN